MDLHIYQVVNIYLYTGLIIFRSQVRILPGPP